MANSVEPEFATAQPRLFLKFISFKIVHSFENKDNEETNKENEETNINGRSTVSWGFNLNS